MRYIHFANMTYSWTYFVHFTIPLWLSFKYFFNIDGAMHFSNTNSVEDASDMNWILFRASRIIICDCLWSGFESQSHECESITLATALPRDTYLQQSNIDCLEPCHDCCIYSYHLLTPTAHSDCSLRLLTPTAHSYCSLPQCNVLLSAASHAFNQLIRLHYTHPICIKSRVWIKTNRTKKILSIKHLLFPWYM